MNPTNIAIFAIICCCLVQCIIAKDDAAAAKGSGPAHADKSIAPSKKDDSPAHALERQKRTLLTHKKLVGSGSVGFGLGFGRETPDLHHVYLPGLHLPLRGRQYVEYVDKPTYVERLINPYE